MSQNFLNLADTAMVGRLGAASLAAVGLGGVATFLAFSYLLGLSPAVQAIAARRLGERKPDETAYALNTGLVVALGVGAVLTVALYRLVPFLLGRLNSDPQVLAAGIPYLEARVLSIAGVGVNFSFRGYWNGINRPKCYMLTLVTMNVLNIVFNYMFIFGRWGAPAMGAAGAGYASLLATYCGSILYLYLGYKLARPSGFLKHVPGWQSLKALTRLSTPSGLQNMFYAGGVTALFWIIGKVGTAELAAANVIVNIELVGVMPALGFGLAATSLVGQALGNGSPDEAARWGWATARVAGFALGLLGVAMIAWPCTLLGLFTPDEAVIRTGCLPLRLAGIGMPLQAAGLVLMHAMMGAGDNRRVMLISIVSQWGLLLPAAYVLGPLVGGSLAAIYGAQLGYRSVQAAIFALLWRGTHWRTLEV